jgi:hypothetical protein
MSLRVDVWDLPGLLRRGPVSVPVAIGSQRWTAVPRRVLQVRSSRTPGVIYQVALDLNGPLDRRRRALLWIDERLLACPLLAEAITGRIVGWLPHSCDSRDLKFQPVCRRHRKCQASGFTPLQPESRRASIGSMRLARQAGTALATTATAISASAESARAPGSGVTP